MERCRENKRGIEEDRKREGEREQERKQFGSPRKGALEKHRYKETVE